MAQDLDLNLPPNAPATYTDEHQNSDSKPAALYTLVTLSDNGLHEVARVCESECLTDEGEAVRPAPEPHFVSEPLVAVYQSHLQLAGQGEFDPYYFIVVVDKDWKNNGVLLVTLYTDDEPPAIDSFLCKAEEAGSLVQNLQIANTDWEECRENYEIGVEDESDGDDNDDEDAEEGDDDVVEPPTDAAEGQSEDEGPEYPSKKPDYDYLIPIYTLESVNADAIVSSLEQDIEDKPSPFNDFQVRHQASLKPTGPSIKDITTLSKPDPQITKGLVAEACALHPIRCRANKWLNKSYFLVCDNTESTTSGLLIVKLTWDGVTKGRSKAELREIGSTASHETIRVEGTNTEAIRYAYSNIVDGTAIFSRAHPSFFVFQLNADMPHQGVKLVDPEYWDRKMRDKYCVVAWTPIQVQVSPKAAEAFDRLWTLAEAVDAFPWMCYANRFEEHFSRQYFVWFDHKTVKEQGVVIVRYNWDMNIERSEGELWALRSDTVKTMRVPVKEAKSKTLAAIKDGSDDWAWEAYTA